MRPDNEDDAWHHRLDDEDDRLLDLRDLRFSTGDEDLDLDLDAVLLPVLPDLVLELLGEAVRERERFLLGECDFFLLSFSAVAAFCLTDFID